MDNNHLKVEELARSFPALGYDAVLQKADTHCEENLDSTVSESKFYCQILYFGTLGF